MNCQTLNVVQQEQDRGVLYHIKDHSS